MEKNADKNIPTKQMGKLFDEHENELLSKVRAERESERAAEAQVSSLINAIKKKLNNG